MLATSIDWQQLSISCHKGICGVTIDGGLIPELLAAAGCTSMRKASCRRQVRDLILAGLVEARHIPIVQHDDHIWFGQRGEDWYLTFFSR